MTATLAIPDNTAATFLTHFFSTGFADDTNIMERFHAIVNGDIRRCPDPLSSAEPIREARSQIPMARNRLFDGSPRRPDLNRQAVGLQMRIADPPPVACRRADPGLFAAAWPFAGRRWCPGRKPVGGWRPGGSAAAVPRYRQMEAAR